MGSDYVEWKDVAPAKDGFPGTDEKNVQYLWLKSGKTYKIRPIHLPVHFYKYFQKQGNKVRIAICGDPDNCPVRMSHPDLKPQERYAIFVIDRADNKIKVMEGPRSVFLPMRKRSEITGKMPGSKEGGDWQIEITGSGLRTEYFVTYIEDNPFSTEEMAMIKKVLGADKERLKKIFKVDDPNTIEKKLFGNEDDDESSQTENTDTSSDDEDVNLDW